LNYICAQRSGDFDVAVRVEGIGASDARARAGLMLREDLTPGAREYLVTVGPGATNAADGSGAGYNGVETLERSAANALLTGFPNSPNPPVLGSSYGNGQTNLYPIWLRLRRTGSSVYAYTGADGTNWYLCARDNSLPANWAGTFYVGMVTTANSLTNYTQARFSHYGDYVAPALRQALLVAGGNNGSSGGLSGLVNGGSTGFTIPSALDTPAGAPNAPGVWQPSDLWLYNLLTTNLGYSVTVVDGYTARSEDAAGMSLLLWGGTVYSWDVGNKFQTSGVPVVVWKAGSAPRNGWGTGNGNSSSQTQLKIVHTNNPIVAGLFPSNSVLTVSGSGQYFGYVTSLASGFTVVGVNPANSAQYLAYYAEKGAQLNGNAPTNIASARIVGLWLGDNGNSSIGDWSQATYYGYTLLLNSLNWAAQNPALITGQPQSTNVPAGATATFTVTVTNNATTPLSYQWWQVVPGISTSAVANASSVALANAYTTPPLWAANSGWQYYVVVTNALNAVTSLVATLMVPQAQLSPPTLANGTNLIVSWTGGGLLQSATNVTGPWTLLTNSTSPFTSPISSDTPRQFFRVQQ
jgi:hypothetical protein